MREIIFEGHGIEIIKCNDKFFLCYDRGELVIDVVELQISEDEASKAMESEAAAYEVILQARR